MGPNGKSLTFAVLGLGEAGSLIARDLVHAGYAVRGWDPDLHGDLSEIPLAESHTAAVADAEVVISVNWAIVAEEVARETVPFLYQGRIYADHNTAGPQLKRNLAAIVEPSGAAFVDVAMMTPVPPLGIRVPMFLSGSGAKRLAELYRALGAPIGFVGDEPGEAAARKLTRSVFFKGMASSIWEALEAARAAGVEEWLRDEIARTLAEADASTLDRIVEGTSKHAKRRAHEMRDAAALLDELGIPNPVTRGTAESLKRIAQASSSSTSR